MQPRSVVGPERLSGCSALWAFGLSTQKQAIKVLIRMQPSWDTTIPTAVEMTRFPLWFYYIRYTGKQWLEGVGDVGSRLPSASPVDKITLLALFEPEHSSSLDSANQPETE